MGIDARAVAMWFDQFDWALTPEEYAGYGLCVPEGAGMTDGFIALHGRERLAWVRRQKAIWAWRKFRKARRWSHVLGLLPWVRMIAVGNALGYGNCRDASDIDLVIVTASRRVWLTRLLVVGILKLLRQRPGEHGRDALCPSFFFSTEAMNLEQLQIKHAACRMQHAAPPPDPYLLFWVTQLSVLVDRDGTYDAFWHANAPWAQRWLPGVAPRGVHPRFVRRRASGVRYRAPSVGLDALERWARTFQERRLPSDARALANRDSRVIVSDHMIKLHTNDRRSEHRERWLRACV